MNIELINTVQDFLARADTSPLRFEDYESPLSVFESGKYSVDSMVKRVLEISQVYRSETTDGVTQTRNGRARSSLDIWRHIKFFHPEVTYFQVLASLWNIRDNLYSLHCCDIDRRVFKWVGTEKSENVYHGARDEFGLQYAGWTVFPEILAEMEARKNANTD